MFCYALLALMRFWSSNSCKWTICVYMCLQFTVSMLFKVPWTGRLCVEVRTAWASHMVTWHASKGNAFRRGISHHIQNGCTASHILPPDIWLAALHLNCDCGFGDNERLATRNIQIALKEHKDQEMWVWPSFTRLLSLSIIRPWISKESHLQNYCISSAAWNYQSHNTALYVCLICMCYTSNRWFQVIWLQYHTNRISKPPWVKPTSSISTGSKQIQRIRVATIGSWLDFNCVGLWHWKRESHLQTLVEQTYMD